MSNDSKIIDFASERLKRLLEEVAEEWELHLEKLSPEELQEILDSLESNRIEEGIKPEEIKKAEQKAPPEN